MRLIIQAYHIGDRLNLKKVQQVLDQDPIKSDPTFCFYEGADSSYSYFKDFGAIVFINMGNQKVGHTMAKLSPKPLNQGEEYNLYVGESQEMKADFNSIWIPEINLDLLHIICLNIAQSLALDQYQKEVDILLEKTRVITSQLALTGKIHRSQRNLARFTGEIMSLRNRMADNLYIFETPPLAWKDTRLSEMDEILNHELDFTNRHRSVQHSLLVVRDNHEFFNNLLQHKHSSLLEWIIIILILFEVFHIFLN